MAQLSRPYQIALVALLVLAVAWFGLASHRGGSSPPTSPSSSSPAPSAPATPTHASAPSSSQPGLAAAEEKAAATPTPVYHGPAPGLEGLTRDIARAHEAVATSQTYAKHLQEKSAQALSPSTSTPTSSGAGTATTSTTATPKISSTPAPTKPSSPSHPSTPAARSSSVPSGQEKVEAALAAGKVPLLLFWNPAGADDVAVHVQVRQLGHSHLPVVVYEGTPEDVAAYGAITREVPVYGTPTILIVAKNGQTTELTGLQEDFAIEQAIEEARG